MIDEQAVIRQVQQGDHEAFAVLVTAYEKQVYNLCLRMVNDPQDAQDLAQEAFLKAWRGAAFYKGDSSFATWLYRLTTNVCIDHLRRQKRRATVSLTTEEDAEEWELPDPSSDPHRLLERKEEHRLVAEAMAQLEEEFRTVLTLRVVQDLPYEQIAEILDLKVGTVKSRLARARLKLKNILLSSGNIFNMDASNSTEKGVDAP